jgi:hypothetical protein
MGESLSREFEFGLEREGAAGFYQGWGEASKVGWACRVVPPPGVIITDEEIVDKKSALSPSVKIQPRPRPAASHSQSG